MATDNVTQCGLCQQCGGRGWVTVADNGRLNDFICSKCNGWQFEDDWTKYYYPIPPHGE